MVTLGSCGLHGPVKRHRPKQEASVRSTAVLIVANCTTSTLAPALLQGYDQYLTDLLERSYEQLQVCAPPGAPDCADSRRLCDLVNCLVYHPARGMPCSFPNQTIELIAGPARGARTAVPRQC